MRLRRAWMRTILGAASLTACPAPAPRGIVVLVAVVRIL